MSNFWWLEPEWKQACCPQCGANIWGSGGDPDWGLCYGCFTASMEEDRQREEYEQEQREIENREMEEHFRKHPHG